MTPTKRSLAVWALAALVSVMGWEAEAQSPPTFDKVFSPDTIGPGAVSTLTFTIDNIEPVTVTDLAFTDILPAGVTIADGAPATTCQFATLSAPTGGTTISLSGGAVGASSTCTVTVDVTSSTVDTHMNVSGDLTSSLGNSGFADDDLMVVATLPGFTKSFDDPTPSLGQTVTMTYLIDNSANASDVISLQFTETLPAGFSFASPANASTTCNPPSGSATLTASGDTLELQSFGISGFPALAAGATCTVSVDILATVGGQTTFTSNDLLATIGFTTSSAGKSAASLDVFVSEVNLAKEFQTNPVNAGGTTNLLFTIDNFNRSDSATDVAFTDDLTFLPGLTFSGLVSNSCGGTVGGTGGTTITFSGGTVAPGGQCTIEVSLAVPAGASGGTYTNTTTGLTATVGGAFVEGNAATDDLIIPAGGGAPIAVLEILEPGTFAADPTPGPGDDVVLRFTITNGSSTSAATDLELFQELAPPLATLYSVSLPPTPDPPCGGASSVTDTGTGLQLTGGSLAAAGGAGDSCTFDITLTLADDQPSGLVTLTPDAPTATVAGSTVTGTSTGDSMDVAAGLDLTFTKTFESAAIPGGTVPLTFEITNALESTDAQAIAFSDNLNAMLTGATGDAVTFDDCGGSFTGLGTGTISYSGGTLATDSSCSITVTVSVPGTADYGSFTNTTSGLSAEPAGGGTAANFPAAEDELVVAGLDFTKEFLTDPALPGESITLRFSIENLSPTDDATITLFTDNLDGALSGLAATGPATFDDCGGTLTGTTFLIYTGGSVLAGDSCRIDVPVLVPPAAADGVYNNITSSLAATQGGSSVTADPAVDTLTVEAAVLLLSKEFTDDPVAPGGTVTLEFTLENSSSQAASGIAFTDDLDAMLTGAAPAGLPIAACGGTVADAGGGVIDFSGGSLASGATCSFQVSVSIPGGATSGDKTNTTSDVSGTVGGLAVTGDAATDTLVVSTVRTTFTKTFSYTGGASAAIPGDTATLSFTITNNNTNAVNQLAFTDDLDAALTGLTVSSIPDAAPCGTSSSVSGAGTGFLTFSGGEVAGSGGVCSFDVIVAVPSSAAAGDYTNTTSELTSGPQSSADPAADDLSVVAAVDVSATKTDGVTTATPGGSLTYTIEVANAGPSADPSVGVADTFPGVLECSYSSVAAGGASGNSSNASTVAGIADTLSMPAGSSVTYTVDCDIPSSATGPLTNEVTATPSINDINPGNETAADDDTVLAPQADLSVSKDDGVTTATPGENVVYTIVVQNAGPSDDPSVTLTDTFPGNLTCSHSVVFAGGAGGTASTAGNISDTLSLPAGSSATYTSTCAIATSATGTLENTATVTGSVAEDAPGDESATDDDTVLTPQADISVTKSDGLTEVNAGGSLTYTIDVINQGPSDDTAVAFGDTLPTDLSCTYTSTNAGGAAGNSSSATPVAAISDTLSMPFDSSVQYLVSCTVDVAATGTLENTASVTPSVSDPDTDNNSATDDDTAIIPAELGFTKAFADDPIDQGAETVLTFTIDNTGNVVAATGLDFDDTLPTGLVLADDPAAFDGCGGTLTAVAGASTIDFTGGSVAAGASCEIRVTVRAPGSGTLDNITSILTSNLPDAAPAEASLTVNPAVAPGFSKAFDPAAIDQGEETTLIFTIDNGANSIEAASLDFDDPLPAGLVVADDPAVSSTCGGTVTAAAGGSTIDFTGGTAGAGSSCEIRVDLRATGSGLLENTTSVLTSSLPESAPAEAALSVTAAGAPAFTKAFDPDAVNQGEQTTLIFTIDNGANSIEATDLDFDDPLPAGLVVADDPAVSNTCGGTVTAAAGGGSIDFTGGTVDAGLSCEIRVDLRALEGGDLDNTTSTLTSSLPDSAPAIATLSVTPAPAPAFSKAFAPDTITQGEVTTLTFTIDNGANAIAATDLDFDDPLPAGLAVADDPATANSCGGTVTAAAGTSVIDLTGGAVAEGGVCEISVSVRATASGNLDNATSVLTSSLDADAPPAEATLTVIAADPPVFSKAFADPAVDTGTTTTLSFTIDNGANLVEATGLAFTDPFPDGLAVAGTPAVGNGCGGTFTATAGAAQVDLTGGTVAAGAACTIDVTVQALQPGTLDNVTTALASSLGDADPAEASLEVAEVPLELSMAFVPSTIGQTGISRVTFGMRNVAAIAAGSVSLTDALPADVVIAADPQAQHDCGPGTLTAPAGGGTIGFTGGTLAAGNRCAISVNVTSAVVGVYPDTTEAASSSLGTSAPASATLTVEAAAAGSITIVQNSDTDGIYEFTSDEPALNQLVEVVGGTGRFGPVDLPAGRYRITQAPPDGVGNTEIVCDDGNSRGNARNRVITVNLEALEAVTCTITSIATRQKTVDTINRFLTKRVDLVLSSEPRPGRRFDRLNRGFGNATRFSWSPGDLKAFLPFTADIRRGSNEFRFSTSMVQMREAAASLKLAHGAEKAVYVDNYRFDAWFEAQYKEFDGTDGQGHFAIAYLGADYLLTPDILIGALLQVDNMEDVSLAANSTARGTGWMVGPYITARLRPNLYFDGRIAAGRSNNEVSPFNTYTDDFSTDRWLAMASLTGELQRGAWTIRPAASLSYMQETQDGYTDALGVTIPSQTVELGQIKIGPTFTGRFETDTGMIYSPYFSLDAIYNIGGTSGVTVTNPATPSTEGWRGRLQAGVDFTTKGGTRLSFGGTYDGLGRSDFNVWGLMFDITIPLQKAKAR